MAGFVWNSMPRDLSLGRKRPYPTPQIACRICDQVFMSTQALINHLESHMLEDDALNRRQREINLRLSQRENLVLSNPSFALEPTPLRRPAVPSSGFIMNNPQAVHERNPFPVPTTTTPPPSRFMPRPVHQSFRARRFNHHHHHHHGAQLPPGCTNMSQFAQYMATLEAPADYHPPFSAPKPPTNVPAGPPGPVVRPPVLINQQDHNNNNNNNNTSEPLDLTLRL